MAYLPRCDSTTSHFTTISTTTKKQQQQQMKRQTKSQVQIQVLIKMCNLNVTLQRLQRKD